MGLDLGNDDDLDLGNGDDLDLGNGDDLDLGNGDDLDIGKGDDLIQPDDGNILAEGDVVRYFLLQGSNFLPKILKPKKT